MVRAVSPLRRNFTCTKYRDLELSTELLFTALIVGVTTTGGSKGLRLEIITERETLRTSCVFWRSKMVTPYVYTSGQVRSPYAASHMQFTTPQCGVKRWTADCLGNCINKPICDKHAAHIKATWGLLMCKTNYVERVGRQILSVCCSW
jgi:hypothetical protein